jgi:thymidylate synthase
LTKQLFKEWILFCWEVLKLEKPLKLFNYENSIDLRQQLFESLVARKLVALEGLHKSSQFAKSYSFPQKALKHNDKTTVRNRVLQNHRMEDNILPSIETDRRQLETNEGKSDADQLLIETLLQR